MDKEQELTTVDGYHVVDSKGRTPVTVMTERDLLEELVTSQRALTDLVNGFFGDLQSGKINPMQMMMGMFKK